MHRVRASLILVATTLAVASSASAAVIERTYTDGVWEAFAGIYTRKMDFDLDLGFGVAAVDSIRVQLSGTSHQGTCYGPSQGEYQITWDCWDLIKAYVLYETPQSSCETLSPDPTAENACVAAIYVPEGDLAPFDVSRRISGLELIAARPDEYVVTDSAPELGQLFVDGTATLRLERIDGGHYAYRCLSGLADIDQVVVFIFYNEALATAESTWGAMKARYR